MFLIFFSPYSDNSLLLFRNQNNKKLETHGLMEQNQKDRLHVLHFLFFNTALENDNLWSDQLGLNWHDKIIDLEMLLKL